MEAKLGLEDEMGWEDICQTQFILYFEPKARDLTIETRLNVYFCGSHTRSDPSYGQVPNNKTTTTKRGRSNK